MAERSVFLNVPFDREYEAVLCAIVSTLVGLGFVPKTVLDADPGRNRMDRLVEVISACRYSLHDLSRVQPTGGFPRFNMPFEFGIAVGYARWGRRSPKEHTTFVLESREHRLQRTLSDANGLDPHVHANTIVGAVGAVFECFGAREGLERPKELKRVALQVWRQVPDLKRRLGGRGLCSRQGFRTLVALATELIRASARAKRSPEFGRAPGRRAPSGAVVRREARRGTVRARGRPSRA